MMHGRLKLCVLQAIEEGSLDQAEEAVNQVIEQQPTNGKAFFRRGQACQRHFSSGSGIFFQSFLGACADCTSAS